MFHSNHFTAVYPCMWSGDGTYTSCSKLRLYPTKASTRVLRPRHSNDLTSLRSWLLDWKDAEAIISKQNSCHKASKDGQWYLSEMSGVKKSFQGLHYAGKPRKLWYLCMHIMYIIQYIHGVQKLACMWLKINMVRYQ